MARFADQVGFSVVLFMVLAGFREDPFQISSAYLSASVEQFLSMVLPFALWLLVLEPFLLTVYGTTPFKALLGLQVRTQEGALPGYVMSLKRAFFVLLMGWALFLPVVTLFAALLGYLYVVRRGEASWDHHLKLRVEHEPSVLWFSVVLIGLGGLMGLTILAPILE